MSKKIYNQPIVEVMNVSLTTPILAGSGNVDLGGGGGGSIDPD